jgi:carboxypeptidase Taq
MHGMSNAQKAYDDLVREMREISTLASIGSLLGWDEHTYMPPGGAENRANQSSLIARMVHERATSQKIGEWLTAVEQSDLVRDPYSDAGANVREWRRGYDRATKIPSSLVEEMSRTEVMAQQAWAEARKESSFAKFSPWLKKTVDLKKQEAECVGYSEHIYDALLDPYEPGERAANLRKGIARAAGRFDRADRVVRQTGADRTRGAVVSCRGAGEALAYGRGGDRVRLQLRADGHLRSPLLL